MLIGALARESVEGPHAPLPPRNIRATRISVGSRAMFEAMLRALALHEVHPVVDRVFGFEEALGYCVGTAVRDKDGISAAQMISV